MTTNNQVLVFIAVFLAAVIVVAASSSSLITDNIGLPVLGSFFLFWVLKIIIKNALKNEKRT